MNVAKLRRRLAGQVIEAQAIEGADCRSAIALQSQWLGCDVKDSTFAMGNFGGATFDRCFFSDCDFRQAILVGRFIDSTFHNCDFDNANFSAAEVRACHFVGGRAQYSIWERATVLETRLGMDFHGARLDFAEGRGIDWSNANLWNALIPLGCAFFAGSTIDSRQANMFLSLLCETNGGFEHEPVEQLIAPIPRKAVARLVRG